MTNKYVKKPIPIEAFQFGIDVEPEWFKPLCIIDAGEPPRKKGCIETLEGAMWFWEGDYVIKGIREEIYPCREDIFKETYELFKE